MTETLRILAIYAHPDDELSAGGALARYAHSGAEATLVCATRGEAATIYCEGCATPESLAAVRTQELACCCQELGITRWEWLDWPDGGVNTVPMTHAVAQLVPIIRRFQPHVLLTHPEHGGYPHPDHLGVHERVLEAFHRAADPAYRPELGPVWITPKLYVRAIPDFIFDRVPGFRDYRVQLNGQALPFHPDPPESLHCVIDCAGWVEHRLAGWQCHRSQHNPEGVFNRLPADIQRQVYASEYFRLVAHHLPEALPPHTSFEAGLPAFHHA